MITETEGIILRQTKIAGGRRMVLLFSKKFGKISAGTGLSERGKGKSAIAMRPFTRGRYEIYKKGDFFNIDAAESIASYYRIGEDVDKYMAASYVLEFCDKVTAIGQPQPGLFNLTCDALKELETRPGKYETLLLAYEIKALKHLGLLPVLDACSGCGKKKETPFFSISGGGCMCRECKGESNDSLIYDIDFDMIRVLEYLIKNPLEALKKIALEETLCRRIRRMITEYAGYHLDFGELESEKYIEGKI